MTTTPERIAEAIAAIEKVSRGYTASLSIDSKSPLTVTSWGDLENEVTEGWR